MIKVLISEENFEQIVKRMKEVIQTVQEGERVDPKKEARSMIQDLGIGRASEQLKSKYYTPDSEDIENPTNVS